MFEMIEGYWARIEAVGRFVRSFIELHKGNCQIVILGCGFDSLFWRLRDKGFTPTKWIDIDLPPVVFKKSKAIQMNQSHFFSNETPLKSLPMPGGDNSQTSLPPPSQMSSK